MIAHGDARDTRTDLGDDAGAFVSADHRVDGLDPHRLLEVGRRIEIAGEEMFIAVAQAGVRPPDEHLAGLGRIDLDLLDRPVLIGTVDDSGFAPHSDTPKCAIGMGVAVTLSCAPTRPGTPTSWQNDTDTDDPAGRSARIAYRHRARAS